MNPAALAFPLIFLSAGEPSGDLLGARLMRALKARTEGRIRFAGIGGERMIAEGLESLFPISELALFGVLELLPKLPNLIRRLDQTVKTVCQLHPHALVTIDAPGFNLRLARRIREWQGPHGNVPLIHYVAPTVWAWRPERARKIAAYLDHLMVLLPFEPPYFEREGLPCTFVGHPVVEGEAGQGDGARFRAAHNLDAKQKIIAVLPGSRAGEVTRLLPDFGRTLGLLAQTRPELVAAVPTVPDMAKQVEAAIATWPVPSILIRDDREKFDAFAAAKVALAASGTVSLELALARLPAVVAYRLNPVTVFLYRRLIKTKYVNLVNVMLDKLLVPELLQERCRPPLLAAEVARLLDDPEARRQQIEGVSEVDLWLGEGGMPPSERAAEVVLSLMRKAGVTHDFGGQGFALDPLYLGQQSELSQEIGSRG
ncbi:Lipid-A-disaccharide synthase [uncultured Gammaproteobacteria bacterium]